MKRSCLMLLAVFAWNSPIAAARAQTWPAEAVRVIVPYGAGSTTDIVPRAVFEQLAPPTRPAHHRRKSSWRRRHDRQRPCRRGEAERLYASGQLDRSHHSARALSSAELRSQA